MERQLHKPDWPLQLEWRPAPKRYERHGPVHIRPLVLHGNAFEVARENYGKYARMDFGEDLLHYLRTGFVVSRPSLFVMGKPIEHGGRRGWFIQIAVGNMLEMLTCFPCELDFIAFCRNGDEDMRVIDFRTFVRKATIRLRRTM